MDIIIFKLFTLLIFSAVFLSLGSWIILFCNLIRKAYSFAFHSKQKYLFKRKTILFAMIFFLELYHHLILSISLLYD